MRNKVKGMIAGVLPNSTKMQVLVSLPRVKAWAASQGDFPVFSDRFKMYDSIQEKTIGDSPMSYLEFGVFQGESIRYWANMHKHDDSRLYGFDTFTGLPEDWESFSGHMKKGDFDVNGNVPQIDDSRVSFHKGLFQDSLEGFLENFEVNGKLVLHLDADLYSATLYVLTRMNHLIKPGTILVFDEFSSVLHEFRALEDYTNSYIREYKVLAATEPFFEQVAVEITK